MKTLVIIESAEKLAVRLFLFVGALCLTGIVLAVGYNVVMRYVFNSPLLWYLELCSIFVVWLAFLPLGANYFLNRHFVIDTFTRLMPKWMEPIQMAVVDILCLLCCGFLVVSSLDAIEINGDMLLNTVPLSLTVASYLPVFIGGASYFVLVILKYVKFALGARSGKAGE